MNNLNPIYLAEDLFLGSLFSSKRPVYLSGKAIRKHFAPTDGVSLTNIAHVNKAAGKEIGRDIAKLRASGKKMPENLPDLLNPLKRMNAQYYQDLTTRIKEHPILSLLDGTFVKLMKFKKQNPEIEKLIVNDPELKAIIERIKDRQLSTGMTRLNSSHHPFEYGDFVATTTNLPKYPGYQKIIFSKWPGFQKVIDMEKQWS